MCLEANCDITHREMQQLIWRAVSEFADVAEIEHCLPNGKIADVYYKFKETEVIVEVKTLLKASLFENAYIKYAGFCDYLVIAAPPQPLPWVRGMPISINRHEYYSRIGVWQVTWLGIVEVRSAARINVKRPGLRAAQSPAVSPCTVIGSPPCTVRKP